MLLLACAQPEPVAESCDVGLVASTTQMPTVFHVKWTTVEPAAGRVSWTLDGVEHVVVEDGPVTEHDVLLTGLPADTSLDVRVSPDGACEEAIPVTTGSLPATLPALTASSIVAERVQPGFTVTSLIQERGSVILVFDPRGRVVWTWPADGTNTPNLVTRARLSLDGTSIVFDNQAISEDDPGQIFRVPLEGGDAVSLQVAGAHTDFVEIEPGVYATLVFEIREMEGRRILGDAIVEVDEDGATRTVWSAFDAFEVDLSEAWPTGWYVPDPTVEDWAHVNGLSWSAEEGAYFVTAGNISAVARIDRDTGATDWVLSDFTGDFATSGSLVTLPHSVQWLDGSALIFNRGDFADPDTCSSAVEVALDESSGTADATWEYRSDPCLLVPFLGGAERLSGGNTLVTWTTAGQIDQVTADGELVWRVNADLGAGFGFGSYVERLGR